MVLSSQAQQRGRTTYTSPYRRKRKQRARRWIGSILVLAVVGYLAWSWMRPRGESSTGPADVRADSGAVKPAGTASTTLHNADVHLSYSAAKGLDAKPDAKPGPTTALGERAVKAELPPGATTEPAKPTPPATNPQTAGASNAPTQPTPVATSLDPEVARTIDAGRQMINSGQRVKGRELLNNALHMPLRPDDAKALRDLLSGLNQDMVFSPKVEPGDPYADTYVVQAGDVLANIAKNYHVPWQFISHINGDLEPRKLRVGMRLKVVKGPFHVVVDKSDFRLDAYLGQPGKGGLFVRSFRVGLGEFDATPVGEFVVKRHSKLENPEWTNPRTGERFVGDNPKNPLGEYWVGLRGADATTEDLKGYGIHGTIEPQSIGTQSSMGCIRMLDDDIKLVYSMLSEEESRVVVVR